MHKFSLRLTGFCSGLMYIFCFFGIGGNIKKLVQSDVAFRGASSGMPHHIAIFGVVDNRGFIGGGHLLHRNRKVVFLVECDLDRDGSSFRNSNISGFVWKPKDVL